MPYRERGLALVTVLLLLAMLLVMALVLADKVINTIRTTLQAGARAQGVQAAGAGIEWARHQLATTYRSSAGWASYLGGSPEGERYAATPAFTTAVGGVAVDIYLRDNPDGDLDPHRDNDLKLFVLARAKPANGSEVVVESLCGFEAAAGSSLQVGQDSRHSGQAMTDGPAEPWTAPVSTFHLRD
jgi:hypothetical protein